MTETFPAKRYSETVFEIVFECAACGRLHATQRAHATTCSTRCRVWLHRHPEHIAELTATCKQQKITLAMVLQARAIHVLMPAEYMRRIIDGDLEIEDTRADVYSVFIKRVMDAVRAA